MRGLRCIRLPFPDGTTLVQHTDRLMVSISVVSCMTMRCPRPPCWLHADSKWKASGSHLCRDALDRESGAHTSLDGPNELILSSGRYNEYDRAIDYLRKPGVLSINDVELLHTQVTQSVAYSSTCDDVESTGFRDSATCDAEADEEEHRVC